MAPKNVNRQMFSKLECFKFWGEVVTMCHESLCKIKVKKSIFTAEDSNSDDKGRGHKSLINSSAMHDRREDSTK